MIYVFAKINNKYAVLDNESAQVNFYSTDDLIELIRKGTKITGVTIEQDRSVTIKVLVPSTFDTIGQEAIKEDINALKETAAYIAEALHLNMSDVMSDENGMYVALRSPKNRYATVYAALDLRDVYVEEPKTEYRKIACKNSVVICNDQMLDEISKMLGGVEVQRPKSRESESKDDSESVQVKVEQAPVTKVVGQEVEKTPVVEEVKKEEEKPVEVKPVEKVEKKIIEVGSSKHIEEASNDSFIMRVAKELKKLEQDEEFKSWNCKCVYKLYLDTNSIDSMKKGDKADALISNIKNYEEEIIKNKTASIGVSFFYGSAEDFAEHLIYMAASDTIDIKFTFNNGTINSKPAKSPEEIIEAVKSMHKARVRYAILKFADKITSNVDAKHTGVEELRDNSGDIYYVIYFKAGSVCTKIMSSLNGIDRMCLCDANNEIDITNIEYFCNMTRLIGLASSIRDKIDIDFEISEEGIMIKNTEFVIKYQNNKPIFSNGNKVFFLEERFDSVILEVEKIRELLAQAEEECKASNLEIKSRARATRQGYEIVLSNDKKITSH